MYTQIIQSAEDTITVPVPVELRGHTLEVDIQDLGKNGTLRPGQRRFASVEEALSHFTAAKLDTRGFKFNREEANKRR